MARFNRGGNTNVCIAEGVKISIQTSLKKFTDDDDRKEYEFPSSLTSEERKFIHNVAQTLGLKTKSSGNGARRFLTAYKSEGSTIIKQDATFDLHRASQRNIVALLQKNGVSERERRELLMPDKPSSSLATGNAEGKEMNCTTGRLSAVIPQVPEVVDDQTNELSRFRQSLPIWGLRNEIVETIGNNSVILITGDTGCGKTTQVPQYLLEYASFSKKPCRIIVAEPRRLAALGVAERVAQERGEKMGQTVGYQIRLESKVSPRTLLTFCTNGVLLRSLMGSDSGLSNVTHVIVDEVHERDRFSDLLLTILRDLIPKNRNLKLIMMSATFDTKRFTNFFGECPVIHVPGICHEVKYCYLEDILKATGHRSAELEHYRRSLKITDPAERNLISWSEVDDDQAAAAVYEPVEEVEEICQEMSSEVKELVNELLKRAWDEGTMEAFEDLLSAYINESVSVDYRHPENRITALLCSACRGKVAFVEAFLKLGANPLLTTPLNNWNALQWATSFGAEEVIEVLEAHVSLRRGVDVERISVHDDLTAETKILLDGYHNLFNDDEVDIELILSLLNYIFVNSTETPKGAVLVFLPGYDEIVTLRERILSDFKNYDASKYVLFTLHSQMQSSDQRRVFRSVPADVRKIILSTNLAETSITIDDVVFVIDAGKVKEKSFDNVLGVSMLKSTWISQSSAIQRRGRAGRCRPGVCYHLYSSYRYKHMQKFQVPEILRMPIHELCLQIKLLAPNVPIADFLARAPDPPSIASLRNSIQMLKAIDALDPWEQLTELGLHLLDLPVEPCLGKMILYSVALKCLDPILTIVCTLAYRDPFFIPGHASMKKAATEAKHKLSFYTLSDHMTLLRAFQNWQKARCDGFEQNFCQHHFISSSTMEMIVGMRAQLLGQLRASGFVRARGAGDIRDLNMNSENWAVVKAALCAGAYPSIIRVDKHRRQLMTQKESKVRFHPSSVLNSPNPKDNVASNRGNILASLPSEWFIYEEMTRIGRNSYARCCSLVSPITVAIFAGPARLPPDSLFNEGKQGCDDDDTYSEDDEEAGNDSTIFKIDDWLTFRITPETAQLAFHLRQKWQALFLRRMSSPTKPLSASDDAVIKTVVEVLTTEEQKLNIPQPVGVGQRPRPMASEYCPPVTNTVLNNSPVQRSASMRSRGRQDYSTRSPRLSYNESRSNGKRF